MVFAVSLGADAVSALVSFLGAITAPVALSRQSTELVGSLAPGRPWLDLGEQLVAIAVAVAPVFLVAHLMGRGGESMAAIGVDASEPGRDALRGAGVAAVIGGAGLALYLAAYHLGVNEAVVAANLPDVWWRVPVLILSAFHNGVVEEVIVLGYLLHRLDQLGWSPLRAAALSAGVRGSYHLYQGVGGFLGNAAMGVIFAGLYRRWGRALPLVVAHGLIDTGAFVGYTYLHGHVAWLP